MATNVGNSPNANTNNTTNVNYTARDLRETMFDKAKSRWGFAIAIKTLLFLIATSALFFPFLVASIRGWSSVVVFFLYLVAEWFQYSGNESKGVAESLNSKIEFEDSLGWKIPKEDLVDIEADLIPKFKKKLQKVHNSNSNSNYFASNQPIGSKRAVENIRESCWWTRHLAQDMFNNCLRLLCGYCAGSIFILVAAAVNNYSFDVVSTIAFTVVGTLTFTFSSGLFKIMLSYRSSFRKATIIEKRAADLIKVGHKISEKDALKLVYECQLNRSSTPLIPTWWYRHRQAYLNELWKKVITP